VGSPWENKAGRALRNDRLGPIGGGANVRPISAELRVQGAVESRRRKS
jgi:hypothetical protein